MKTTTRISHKSAFESCYLRHQYLLRVKHKATREEMAPYYKIVENFARNTFYTYKNLFLLVGLDMEDVLNSAQVQLISFLGLYALERNPKKLADFKHTFRSRNSIICKKEDVLNKNQANFTCFLKQRMEDMVRVCRQKAKNIKGFSAEEFLVFRGEKEPPKDHEDLLENHEKHGYKPLGTSVFKTIKKRMKDRQEGPVYLDGNTWYVCVPIKRKHLALTDFACNNADPYDNLHNMTPEAFYERAESENAFESNSLRFHASSDREKFGLIKSFVNQNAKNIEFKEELDIAYKMLEKLNAADI